MADENEPAKPDEVKPAPAAAAQPAAGAQPHESQGAKPAAVAEKDPFYAEHEAAHAVTLDEGKWSVHEVNLDLRQTSAATKDYTDALADIDLYDPTERAKHEVPILSLVTSAVAGYVAERVIGSTEPLISELLAADEPRLWKPVMPEGSDTKKTVGLLQRLDLNTLEDVIAAEKRAEDILEKRKDHQKALAKLLIEKRVVNGEALAKALGKETPKEEAAG